MSKYIILNPNPNPNPFFTGQSEVNPNPNLNHSNQFSFEKRGLSPVGRAMWGDQVPCDITKDQGGSRNRLS